MVAALVIHDAATHSSLFCLKGVVGRAPRQRVKPGYEVGRAEGQPHRRLA
jgi:hypothetical protein